VCPVLEQWMLASSLLQSSENMQGIGHDFSLKCPLVSPIKSIHGDDKVCGFVINFYEIKKKSVFVNTLGDAETVMNLSRTSKIKDR
jgi:hypothetical protein